MGPSEASIEVTRVKIVQKGALLLALLSSPATIYAQPPKGNIGQGPGGSNQVTGTGKGGRALQPLKGPQNKACKSIYNMSWWDAPPYVSAATQKNSNETPVGLLFDLLKEVVDVCCQGKVTLETVKYQNGPHMEEEWKETEAFAVPVFRSLTQRIFDTSTYMVFLPVIETPGAVYLIHPSDLSVNTFSILAGEWPLILVVMLSAAFAGIAIWVLDSYWNPDHFPRTFLKGFWEGFWWAFVTMTTVGYGDRAPKSIPARLLGMVWILVGLVILSIFTASMTTALTASSLDKGVDLTHKKVGVVNGSAEYQLVIEENARPNTFRDVRALLKGVEDKKIDGALIEYYTYRHFQQADPGNAMKRVAYKGQLKNPAMVGVLIKGTTGKYLDKDTSDCFHRRIIKRGYRTYHELRKRLDHFEGTESTGPSSSLLQVKFLHIIIITFVWLFLFLIGVAWEYLYFKPRQKRRLMDSQTAENVQNAGIACVDVEYGETFIADRRQCPDGISKTKLAFDTNPNRVA